MTEHETFVVHVLPRCGARLVRSAFGHLRSVRLEVQAVCGLAALVAVGGCAQRAAADVAAPHAARAPTRAAIVDVPRTIVTPGEALSVTELYERGRQQFESEEWLPAATTFDRLDAVDPDGPYAGLALFYGGWSYDNAGRNDEALSRYEQYARRYPSGARARAALVRAVRLLTHLGDWHRAGELSDRLLAGHFDLGPLEQVVAFSGKALSLLFGGDADSAEYFIEKGRSAAERARLDAAGQIPTDLARLYFALGELRRVRGERIVFDPRPANFGAALERRCQLLLDAQSAYSDAMRAYDAHWSAMAGYRVGELYQRLHADLLAVEIPPAVDTSDRARLFEGAMRLRYAVLLEKGLAMMEHTVEMAKRTGERSRWVLKAREAIRALDNARKRERAVIDSLPYSRAELQRALDDLAEKAKRSGS